jgi:predicted GIY-YIG superfamily endonuclease
LYVIKKPELKLVTQGRIKDRISDTNWFVYVLKLQDDKYYIGIAIDPKKRFLEHQLQTKDCSNWCKKYKALEIIELIDTEFKAMKDATLLEDIYTLKYIEKYGFENVRGGRYFGNDLKIKKTSKSHLLRGYISVMHKLLEQVNITYSELNELGIYEYVTNNKNSPFINNLILITRKEVEQRKIIIERITNAQHLV